MDSFLNLFLCVCEGAFILSITSKPKISGLFSLLASYFHEFQLFTVHGWHLTSVVVPGTLLVIVSVRFKVERVNSS